MKKRMDNKGFSLVELIIVIAIMAILIGIVGSQVIPYIEKSRISKDKDVVDTCYTALQAAVAKEGVKNINGAELDALDADSGISGMSTEVKESIGNGIKASADLTKKLGSNAYKDGKVRFWFNASTGFIAISVEGKDTKKGQTLVISSLKTLELETKGTMKYDSANASTLTKIEGDCGGKASGSSDD